MINTVLIVDDSATTRALIKRTITLSGVAVTKFVEAGDGQSALDVVSSDAVDVIFLDINMPTMSGTEGVRRLKANPATAGIPVVIVSSESTTSRVDQLRNSGVSGYIKKPFTPEQIRDVFISITGARDAA
jgi:two-component system chemotaxis response regulator CheY